MKLPDDDRRIAALIAANADGHPLDAACGIAWAMLIAAMLAVVVGGMVVAFVGVQ